MTVDKEKRWCYGKMDLLVTEPCDTCKYVEECHRISFEKEAEG